MSGSQDPTRRVRLSRTFLVSVDLKVQDQLDGPVRLHRGNMCREQDAGRSRDRDRDHQFWVKVLDSGVMVKVERRHLVEVPSEISGLLEPVAEPENRLSLLGNPGKLQRLAALPLGSLLWVQMSQPDELAEAELRYRGPLARGSTAVWFGVQLKGSAVGRGASNGSFKGRQYFLCPEGSALFRPANYIRLRRWSRGNGSVETHNHNGLPGNNSHPNNPHQQGGLRSSFHQCLSAPVRIQGPDLPIQVPGPVQVQVGKRVCVSLEDGVQGGEVRFCGPLPGRTALGLHIGILLDAPVGSWDGHYRGDKLCHIPSPLYGVLLPAAKVAPESRSRLQPPPQETIRPALRPVQLPAQPLVQPPVSRPGPTSPLPTHRSALMPPQRTSKPALKPPPLPPPKPLHRPLPLLPPAPPPKPQPVPHSPTSVDHPHPVNAEHSPASPPLRSPGSEDEARWAEDGEAELEVGSMVEVNDPPLFGVIRWIGRISGIHEVVAGVELDQELAAATDGSYLGKRHFRCHANRALFVKLRNCRRDSRFPAPETPVDQVERCNSIVFAEWGSERVEEHTPPLDGDEARELYQGWKRGIQGHLNSCYLDASLFSLFSCSSSADWVMLRPPELCSGSSSVQAQELLRCDIVNPLRRFGYVCASKTMTLRILLESESSDTGFTNQEKDPEEFLNKLFQILNIEPLLKIRSRTQDSQQCHLYQLFPPSIPSPPSSSPTSPSSPSLSPISLSSPLPEGRIRVSSVQALLEASFLHTGLKFAEAPSCLLLLMPRFGKDFKMFDAVLPTLRLDITDLLDDTLRQCSICQAVALWECVQCYEDPDITPGRPKQYCSTCNAQVHSHRKRISHSPDLLVVPRGPWGSPGPADPDDPGGSWGGAPPHATRHFLELFAVTCIQTSHYVSFVKHGPRPSDWLFSDSMADREGGENGFNIPRVRACPEVGRLFGLSEAELSRVDPATLAESPRRLLCDAYMCLYQDAELSLYK